MKKPHYRFRGGLVQQPFVEPCCAAWRNDAVVGDFGVERNVAEGSRCCRRV